ncbi:MAG: hypothetical protein Q7S07_01765 [Candidatus Omnitrophota bacterium]|nr:hypothetical protein [Candidatus Omnitrophota bacterium]
MKKIWVRNNISFKEAGEFDRDYYFSMSRSERLDVTQFLRETYHKFSKGKNENRKGLRGSIKVIQ